MRLHDLIGRSMSAYRAEVYNADGEKVGEAELLEPDKADRRRPGSARFGSRLTIPKGGYILLAQKEGR
jgi:hypothetical protein